MVLFRFHPVSAIIAALASMAGTVVKAEPARGVGVFDNAETRTALKAALAQNQRLQNELAVQKQAGDAASAKAAVLSADATALREENTALKLRLEVLGTTGDEKNFEKRLLDAVNDLRLEREANQQWHRQFQDLSAAVSAYWAASEEQKADLRKNIERVLNDFTATDAVAASTAARIEAGRVVSVKPEERLVVVNTGSQTGLKVGTPLRIYRNDRPMASAVVVEVRSQIAGGLITKTEGEEFPHVGDTLRVDLRGQN